MTAEECRKTKQEALSYLNTRQAAYSESQNNSSFHKRPHKTTFQSRVNCSSFQLIAEVAKKKKKQNLCISTKLQLKKKKKQFHRNVYHD